MSVSATSRTVCPVVELTVRDHPDADRLEIAGHGGYQMVVGKRCLVNRRPGRLRARSVRSAGQSHRRDGPDGQARR